MPYHFSNLHCTCESSNIASTSGHMYCDNKKNVLCTRHMNSSIFKCGVLSGPQARFFYDNFVFFLRKNTFSSTLSSGKFLPPATHCVSCAIKRPILKRHVFHYQNGLFKKLILEGIFWDFKGFLDVLHVYIRARQQVDVPLTFAYRHQTLRFYNTFRNPYRTKGF